MQGEDASAPDGVRRARRRAVRLALIAGGAIIAVLAGIIAVLPFYIEGDAAKVSIERQLSDLTGGEFRYSTLQFRSWPRPTADLRHISFHVAPVVEGTAERALLRFALLPLLKGELKISQLELERPVAVVRVPAFDAARFSDPLVAYRTAIAPALAWLTQQAGGLEVSLREGTVELHRGGGEAPLRLEALTFDGDSVRRCGEGEDRNARRLVEARAREHDDRDGLAGDEPGGRRVDDLDADAVLLSLLGASTVRLHPAATDATLSVQTDGDAR
jgi:hypothetical protein